MFCFTGILNYIYSSYMSRSVRDQTGTSNSKSCTLTNWPELLDAWLALINQRHNYAIEIYR